METQQNNNLTKKEKRELKKIEKKELLLQNEKSKRTKKFFLWGSVFLTLVLGIGSIIFLVSKKGVFESGASEPVLLVLANDDWIKGSENAKTVLVEYSDFQCPACAYFMPVLEKLAADFPNDLKIVYRHFPLPQYQNAKIAAYAAEAAGKQGKFFEMADKIFDRQKEWAEISNEKAENIFKQLAEELKLNIEQFEKDAASEEIKRSVEKDSRDGYVLGINSTPTFFLNGKKIQNPRSYEEFKKVIENEINK